MKEHIDKEDKILLASVEDKIALCREKEMITHTEFLDLRQHSMVLDLCRSYEGLSFGFYGGYDDAERELCVFKPSYVQEPLAEYFKNDPEADLIAWLHITKARGTKALSHRDYLGSLTGLGIRRETTGDIIVRDDGADVAVLRDMANFLNASYFKAGRVEVQTEIVSSKDIVLEAPRLKDIRDTVASLRVDSIVASGFGLSRTKATEAISRGLVFIDGRQISKADAPVEEGARIVLRGSGKCVLSEVGGKTKKGRIYITLQKFI